MIAFERLRQRFFAKDAPNASAWTTLPPESEPSSLGRLHVLGYVLLLYSLLEYGNILYPPQFADPQWEFVTMGQLVENVWGLLVGLAFVLYRCDVPIRRVELRVLSAVSWLSLLLGLVFVLMLPLGIANTVRLDRANLAEFQTSQAAQRERFNAVREFVSSDRLSEENATRLATQLNLPIDGATPTRQRLLQQIDRKQRQVQVQLLTRKGAAREQLFRRAVKWNLGTVMIGFALIWIWWLARDYRQTLRAE